MSNPLRLMRTRRAATVLAAGAAFACLPAVAQASAVDLGTAAPFVVLGGSAVTNTGPSVLNGDLGVSPGTAISGFPPGIVNGTVHDNDAVALQAQSDLTTAYDVAAGQPVTSDLTGQDLGGLQLPAGAYSFSSSAQLTGALTLDAAGDPNAQFVFEIGSTLTTASASSVVLINGASPCNVYWQVGSSATLGTTTAFKGNVMALTSVTLDHAATVQGRALARNGAVTLDDNVVDGSECGTSTTPPPATTTTPAQAPPASRSTIATRKGTATINHPRSEMLTSCTSGFTATVRGRMIKRVVFTLGGKRLASRTGSPFGVYVAAGRHGIIRARVTFRDATRAKTLSLPYRACAAAVRHPQRGPSQFTG
jgi:Ice-binding-like